MNEDQIKNISNAIRDVPDFPKEGIIFKDISTLLGNATLFAQSVDMLAE